MRNQIKNRSMQSLSKRKHQGFTLLELLVAMFIFSLMSVMAYGGLTNVITGNEIISSQEQRLKELQRTMLFIERDMRQLVPRRRATGFNQFSNSFQYGLDSEGLVEFSRAGNPNPIGVTRSSLQRVRYDIEEKTLVRRSWALIDHIDLEPTTMKLLNEIDLFELRLLDRNNVWQDNWRETTDIPKAIEINIEHEKWGKITRLIPVQ